MPTKALMKKGMDGEGTGKDGIQGLDGMQENDKLSAVPLIIDGLEVDRDVSSRLYRFLIDHSHKLFVTESLSTQLFD